MSYNTTTVERRARNSAGAEALAVARRPGEASREKKPAAAGIERFFSLKGSRRERSSESSSSKVVRTSRNILIHQKVAEKCPRIHITVIIAEKKSRRGKKNTNTFILFFQVAGYPEGHPDRIAKVSELGREMSEREKTRVVVCDGEVYVCKVRLA